MRVYTADVDVIQADARQVHFFFKPADESHIFLLEELEFQQAHFISNVALADQILLHHQPSADVHVYVYVKNQELLITKEWDGLSHFHDQPHFYSFTMTNHHHLVSLRQVGLTRVVLIDQQNTVIHQIDDVATREKSSVEIPYELGFTSTFFRFTTIAVARYQEYHLVATYDLFRKVITIEKILFSIERFSETLELTLTSKNELTLKNLETGVKTVVNLARIPRNQGRKVLLLDDVKSEKKRHVLAIFKEDATRFFIYTKSDGIYIGKNNPFKVTGHQVNLKMISGFRNVYFVGRSTHYAYQAAGKYETLYLKDEQHQVTTFKRPFKNLPLLRRYGYYKVPLSRLFRDDQIHTNLFVGDKKAVVHNFKRRFGDKKAKTLLRKKVGEQLLVIRTTLGGNLTVTRIPFAPEYTLWNRLKISAAYVAAKFSRKDALPTNLYFEKKSETAAESGFRVFERVMELAPKTSRNYYILSEKSPEFSKLKEQFGKALIAKYSFRHYLAIFQANYFISSELSNHVLNDRLYIDHLRQKLMDVPLVFLQHGIMFAKPVDNPMAFGFHKDKNLYTMYKSVISSQLEAKEFYKMGYVKEDLIQTGLATLDFATLDPGADKIAYMPTYRYWEEGLIYKGEIEQTTYYKSLIKVIQAFEKAGLLDRLLLVPHNKFSTFIKENMPAYESIISDNPSVALKQSVVFITDYSSAIYDAIFRGAYPIFYWEEKDMLIEQYKAIPPVNENNAPGPIAYDAEQLVELAKHAISREYELEQNYKDRYKAINAFDDRKNTERILAFLQQDNIL